MIEERGEENVMRSGKKVLGKKRWVGEKMREGGGE